MNSDSTRWSDRTDERQREARRGQQTDHDPDVKERPVMTTVTVS
jgi:hypothetical protein